MKTYQKLHMTIVALENCKVSNNEKWIAIHEETIKTIMESAPSGSGFDSGTKLVPTGKAEKLVFETSFHHMDENGMYDGWTEHNVTVKPSFLGFSLSVSGRNKNGIKEYIGDCFYEFLDQER